MRFEGAEPNAIGPDKEPKARLSATRQEVAMARLGYLSTGRAKVLEKLVCGGAEPGEDFTKLTAADAELIVAGNVALVHVVGPEIAQTEAFEVSRNAITSGALALQKAADIDRTTFSHS